MDIEIKLNEKVYHYLENLVLEEFYGETVSEVISNLINRELEILLSKGILKKIIPPPPRPDATPRPSNEISIGKSGLY